MSIVTANQNIRKKEEEEEKKRQEQSKVVGQQQKTQTNSDKPVGSTSIPKDNQKDSRTQKSAASSLRQEPKKEESKQNIIRRNTFTANKEEQKQNNTQQNYSRQSENKKPVFTDFMGNDLSQQKKNTGTWGYNQTVDDARSRYAMSLKDRRQNLDEANSLPTAEEFQRSKMSEQERVKDLFNKDLGSKTKQQGPTVISGKEFTKSDHNTLSAEDLQRGVDSMTPEVLQQWLSPGVQLDRDARKIAKEYARQEREKFNIGANHVPELNSAEDEAKYRDLMSLANKSSPLASFMTGFIDPFYKTAKVGTDAIANNFMDEAAKQQYYQGVENQKSAMQNAQVQNPKLTGAGELAGNATEYAVTEPLVGLVAGALGVTGKAANFVVNQLANAGQDALLSWAPTLNELSKRNGLTPEEKTNTLLKTIGLDVGGNLVGAGVSAGLGNLLSKSAKNAIPEVAETATKEAIPDIAEQAVKETVPQTAEQIIKEASPDVVEQAAKEAAEEIAQQTVKETTPEVAEGVVKNTPQQVDDIAESTVKNTDNVIPDVEEPRPQFEVPKTEKVDRGPEELLVDDGTKRERGYARSTRNNPDIPDDVAADFVDNPEIYNVLHNKDTKAKAQFILDQGFDKAYADYKDLLNKKDPAAVPLGYDLAKQMIDNGDSSGAADLIRDMSKSLTESGQFSQAAAITLMKNDPMTALRYAEKEIDALNTDGAKKFGKKWNDFKLTDDEIKAFSNLDPGDKEGISKLFDQIGTRLGKEYPTTAMEKLLEARRIGMLFNVRTNVRNFGANVPTLGMRWASDRVDAVGQNIAHIINPDFKVTQSLTGSGKEGRKLATEVFDSDKVQALLKGTDGKYADSVKGALVKEKQMYKGTAIDHWIDKMTGGGLQKLNEKAFGKKGVQSIPETIRNATYKALELGDSPFVKENFVERLGSYIKAQGYKSIDEIPDEAIETAWESAMKATYKDQSWAYKMIRDIKQGIEQAGKPGKVASESLIPFVQAPGNIAARMVDYSPIGGANGIRNIIKGAKSGNEKAVREGINQLAQGATGSLALGIGIALHNSGLITGGYSQDKDKKSHEKNNGFREYALHIGDKYYTIDWAQPAFQSLMTGVLLADAINKSDEYDSDLLNYFGVEGSTAGKVIGGSKEAAKTTLNAWFNASPLQSMQDLLGGTYEDSSDIASKLWSVGAENFAGSYVPASVNAIAKTADRTQRQTYDPSSKTASFVNQQIAKIPGVSKMLPAKYNTWGEEIKTADSAEEAAFNRFVNPGEGTTENKKPIDKELDRLFDATGNNAVYPQVAPNKVNNEALTAKQVSELQKDMGEQSYQAATKFMDSDVYKNMTDEQKAEGYSDLYTTVKWAAQLKLTDPELYKKMQDGDEEALSTLTGNGASMKKAYITGGIDTVLDGIKTDAAFDKAGINKSEKAKAIYEAEGEEGLMKYAEQKKTFDVVGAPETDKAKEIYEAEGEEGLERYTQYYNAAKEASGGESVTTAGIVEALKDESPEVQKEMMNSLMPKQADAAIKANESYSNGAYKYYKYKTEADTDGNGRISADESHAYFDALDIPGTEKAYFDKAIRNNAKTSIYDGTAKKGTNKSTAKTSANKPAAQATGNSTFDALMKSKQKARDSYTSSPKTDNTIPDVGSSGWELSNGYNLKNTQTYQRAQAAGVSDNDFLNAWNAADADGNGYIKKAEAQAYVNALPKDEQSKWYNILYKSRSKKKK